VRDIQKELKVRGLTPNPAADESTTGPRTFMLTDPDGNPILIDQHVPSRRSDRRVGVLTCSPWRRTC